MTPSPEDVLVLNDNVALVHPDPELDPLDILLCWHESGNGPKTDIAVASIHVREADLLVARTRAVGSGAFSGVKAVNGR